MTPRMMKVRVRVVVRVSVLPIVVKAHLARKRARINAEGDSRRVSDRAPEDALSPDPVCSHVPLSSGPSQVPAGQVSSGDPILLSQVAVAALLPPKVESGVVSSGDGSRAQMESD